MRVLCFPRRRSRLRAGCEYARALYLAVVACLTLLCLVNVTLLLAASLLGL